MFRISSPVHFELSPVQQAQILDFLSPFFDELVNRMALRARELAEAERPRFYSRQELANILRVSLPTLHSYVRGGRIVPQKVNGRVLFAADEIDKLIASGELKKGGRR